ncbi:TPR domain-containing protein [Fusarium mundagurra]|uniref:TPR domain-containing protein n=1 Tax=Fusarium mundagurra TaxID=1567541 RepID=A0A8H5Z4S9_9HYPO|nr:TPR domain-containing protein [Fusarium mundagurra]
MDLDSLNDAVECLKRAVESPLNRNDSDWPSFADYLARGLSLRYQRTGDKRDLDESVCFQRRGIDHKTFHRDHPNRAVLLNNLGELFYDSYWEGGQIGELVSGIKAFRGAVELGESSGDSNHSAQVVRRYNLGAACYEMYRRTGSQSSALLEKISSNVESANFSMFDDHPEKARWSIALGNIYQTLGDVDKALRYYILSAENQNALPIIRVQAARDGLRIYRSKSDWDKAILLASIASKLLPLVCSRYVSLRDQEHAIANISGFAADACSLFLMSGCPEEALQHLEFGRGLILGYLVDGRSDLSAMKEDNQVCGLVKRYEILRDQLSKVNEAERPSGRRDELVDEIEGCVKDIRRIPKYQRFLQGPEIEELKSVATDCPIIIVNSTDIASHGIIIWKGEVTSLLLEQMSVEAVPEFVRKRLDRYADATRGMPHRHVGRDIYMLPDDDSDFLSWLWTSCVKIILDKLESIGLPLNGERRVWWIGTGAAASFPFHAAGMHSSDPSECTLMKVISSYAPTIKTLRFSRLQSSENSKAGGPNTLLFVGMPTTPGGLRPLPGVLKEESVIREACGEKHKFEARRHPTTSEVLERITESKVVHFACHGLSDPRLPSESHLLLQIQSESGPIIDRLTVERLSKVKAKERSFLAFLSACSTAEVKATSVLSDEAIHLASIFQVSGFAHTIGALWSASDQACVQVAKEFYRNLFKESGGDLSNDMVARALHSAVMKLRSTTDRPETWAPFVHFGA